MSTPLPKLPELSVRINVSPSAILIDRRVQTKGIVFGTISGVAKQYGIKLTQEVGFIKLTGPKSRLQIFVEKLHFARVPYTPI